MSEKQDDDKKDTGSLNSKFHSLFKEKVGETKTQTTIKGKSYYEIVDAHTNYRMFVDAFLEHERGLHEMFNVLWNASEQDTLELRISSGGGYILEGQIFYNLIKNKFNGRTTTVLDSAAYSMGAFIFMSGDKRVVMEQCDLMIHNYSDWVCGKGNEIETQVEHKKRLFNSFFKELLCEQHFINEGEFEQLLIGKDFWFNTEEMCKRGIATHVMVGGKTIKAKKYLKNLNMKKIKPKNKSKNKSKTKK